VFAYGQTGSGKTFTMDGPSDGCADHTGLNRRTLDRLFEDIARRQRRGGLSFRLQVSVAEVYNDRVFDLLGDGALTGGAGAGSSAGTPSAGGGSVGDDDVEREVDGGDLVYGDGDGDGDAGSTVDADSVDAGATSVSAALPLVFLVCCASPRPSPLSAVCSS
jgi:hypothetical protein